MTLVSRLVGGWKATGTNGVSASLRYGRGVQPSRDLTFTTGTGSNQINVIYRRAFEVLTTANLDIDLKGAAGELDVVNAALNFVKVRAVEILLITPPAVGVSVRVGPQGVTNGWIGPWKDGAAYDVVRRRFFMDNPVEGWAVGASNKILRIHNPGAATISGIIEIFGTNA
jgi:hypothetical protein